MPSISEKSSEKKVFIPSLNLRVISSVQRCFEKWFSFLGMENVADLKKNLRDCLRATIVEFSTKDPFTVYPDDILNFMVESFMNADRVGRFEKILSCEGTKAKSTFLPIPFVNFHKSALLPAKHPFYVFSVCLLRTEGASGTDVFNALGLCGDQVFYDTSMCTYHNHVDNFQSTVGIGPSDVVVSSAFTLEMKKCPCGCHDIIVTTVSTNSK